MSDQDSRASAESPEVDKTYLQTRQYRDARNLNARGSLHARFGTNPYPWFRWLFDRLAAVAPENARILEVGCGPAGLWAENLDRLPSGWRMTLTDLSAGMVEAARERLAGAQTGAFTLQSADIEKLPFADGAFEVVIANHMLYHVPDRAKALGELRRVLRPNGAFMAATNGQQNMSELNEIVDRVAPGAHSSAWRDSFRSAFTLENGAAQLAPLFDDIAVIPYDDGLNVTDEAALVAYIGSMDLPELRESEGSAGVEAQVHAQMAALGGVMHISKSVGVFTARAPRA